MDKKSIKTQENDEFFLDLIKQGILSVSNDGKVYNHKTQRDIGFISGKYRQICCSGRNMVIHRLVYYLYVENIPFGYEINHIDGNKLNNHYTNLEAITASENMKHAFRIGLNYKRFGEKNINSKLLDKEALEVREKYATGNYSHGQLAKEYGLTKTGISYVIRGKTYQHLPLQHIPPIKIQSKCSNPIIIEQVIKLHEQGLSSYKIENIIPEISRTTAQRIINKYYNKSKEF